MGTGKVTAPCMIRESHVDPSGSAWMVNVSCTEATNTPTDRGRYLLQRGELPASVVDR